MVVLTNRHVRSSHVVVDTTNETDDIEMLIVVELRLRDLACEGINSANVETKVEQSIPSFNKAAICSGHSARSRSAPVSDPSPPQTTSASIPCLTKFNTAFRRPSISRNAAHRAVPMSVPPAAKNPRMSSHPTWWIPSRISIHHRN